MRAGAMLGEDGVRLDRAVGPRDQSVVRARPSGDGRLEGNREDVQRFAITIGAACRSP